MNWISFKDQRPSLKHGEEFLLYDEGKVRVSWFTTDETLVTLCGCTQESKCCLSKKISDEACWMILPEKPK